jgi:hypothetical protein
MQHLSYQPYCPVTRAGRLLCVQVDLAASRRVVEWHHKPVGVTAAADGIQDHLG